MSTLPKPDPAKRECQTEGLRMPALFHRDGRAWLGWLRRQAARFIVGQAGSTLTVFALTLPVLGAAAGVAVDYSLAASTRTKMQATADAAAVAGARELQLARSDASRIVTVANNMINSSLSDVAPAVNVDFQAMTVQVVIDKVYTPVVRLTSAVQLHVTATAKMSGSMPLCLLGLDPSAPQTVGLEQGAMLTAPGCLVQSNSKSTVGLQSKDNAVMTAGMICSAGGKVQTSNSNYSPGPTTDCPVLPDPLSSRPTPPVGACDYTNKVVDGISATLQPGVYCGGLTLTNGATVNLSSGIFVIKDGPLMVDGTTSISGTEVGFYLTGSGSNFTFDADTTVSLSAPKGGPLTGILIFDDPSGAAAAAKAPKSGRGAAGRANKGGAKRQHQILSDNARNLLGTIYMPQGEIIIDATKPIADKSAYTVLVVDQIHLYSGPNLILNTDYSATDVPVPMGVGPYGAKMFLSN
jgi:Flp pilus assembly protein TadG